jgi:hypothetical protein
MTSFASDKVNLSRSIKFSKLIKAKIKEGLRVFIGVNCIMASRVLASSVVSEPDIVASSGSDESWSVNFIADPSVST